MKLSIKAIQEISLVMSEDETRWLLHELKYPKQHNEVCVCVKKNEEYNEMRSKLIDLLSNINF